MLTIFKQRDAIVASRRFQAIHDLGAIPTAVNQCRIHACPKCGIVPTSDKQRVRCGCGHNYMQVRVKDMFSTYYDTETQS